MPYHIEKVTKSGWVVVKDSTGEHMSRKPLTKAKAQAQLYALRKSMEKER